MSIYLLDHQKDDIQCKTGLSKLELEGVWALIKLYVDSNLRRERTQEENWKMGKIDI